VVEKGKKSIPSTPQEYNFLDGKFEREDLSHYRFALKDLGLVKIDKD